MIDFARGEVVPTQAAVETLLEWTEPARSELGLEVEIPERNGAMRDRAAVADGRAIPDVYGDAVAATRASYAPERVIG